MSALCIKWLEAKAGFLGNAGRFEFAEGLTFALGPKGVFKSTLVELIRCVLGIDEERISGLLAEDGRITRALGGDTVLCELDTEFGPVRAERGVDGGVQLSRKIDLSGVVVLSQGDIRRLAEDVKRRLDLVDQAHLDRKIEILEERGACGTKSAQLDQELVPVRKRIKDKLEEVKAEADARAKLEEIAKDPNRPKRPEALTKEHEAHMAREALLGRVGDAIEFRERLLSVLRDLFEEGRDVGPTAEELAATGELWGESGAAVREIGAMLRESAITLARAEKWCSKQPPAAQVHDRLKAEFETQARPYKRLVVLDHEETTLRAIIARAERARAELVTLRRQEERLKAERAAVRARRDALENELRDLRERRVRELDSVNPFTAVRLVRRANASGYYDALADVLGQKTLTVLQKAAADHLTPDELIDVVESGDDSRIKALTARHADATKFVEKLQTSTKLFTRLEQVFLDDEVAITFREGEVETPAEHLSEGQRATAILPLLLQKDRLHIILLDEPETHLDGRFICSTLLPQLRELKETVQVICVTHNANLVALGRPDHVIVMDKAGPNEAAKPLQGSFEETKNAVVALLEGGGIAFRERERLYKLPPLEELERALLAQGAPFGAVVEGATTDEEEAEGGVLAAQDAIIGEEEVAW